MRDYIEQAIRTESADFEAIARRLTGTEESMRLLHAAMGIATESGELLDMLKKRFFYGKPVDRVNAIEEMGDLCWYMAIACDVLGVSFEEIMAINIAKLKKRYPERFEEEQAVTRDLGEERQVLETLHTAVTAGLVEPGKVGKIEERMITE